MKNKCLLITGLLIWTSIFAAANVQGVLADGKFKDVNSLSIEIGVPELDEISKNNKGVQNLTEEELDKLNYDLFHLEKDDLTAEKIKKSILDKALEDNPVISNDGKKMLK